MRQMRAMYYHRLKYVHGRRTRNVADDLKDNRIRAYLHFCSSSLHFYSLLDLCLTSLLY